MVDGLAVAGNDDAGILPAVQVGFAIDLDRSTILSIDADHRSTRTTGTALALSAHPVPELVTRIGAGIGPARIAGGLGYRRPPLSIDIGVAFVVPLGFVQSIGVGVEL
jgi:hypothetical protein